MKWEKGKDRSEMSRVLKNEIRALSASHHQNILHLNEYWIREVATFNDMSTADVSYLSLEYAQNMDLATYINGWNGLPEPIARFYFRQLISAITHLSDKGYSHRDIKLENCLLDYKYDLKLADFGLASKAAETYEWAGTMCYMAPEVIKQADHNTISADVYSAGVFLFAMVTGIIPFLKATKSDNWYSKVISGDWEELWEFFINNKGCPRDLSDELKDLVEKLLHHDPSKRLTLEKVMQHDWCNGKTATSDEIVKYMSNRKEAIEDNGLKRNSKPSKSDYEGKDDIDSDSDEISESLEEDPSKSMKISENLVLSKLFIEKNAKVLFSSLKAFFGERHISATPNPKELSLLIEIVGKELLSKISLSISTPFGPQMSCIVLTLQKGSKEVFNALWSKISSHLKAQLSEF